MANMSMAQALGFVLGPGTVPIYSITQYILSYIEDSPPFFLF